MLIKKLLGLVKSPAEPEYVTNSHGNTVPLECVQEIDKIRDAFIKRWIPRVKAERARLETLKTEAFEEFAEFLSISMAEYGVKSGGEKGNATITSYDGQYKMTRTMADCLTFDERILAAQNLINECLTEWGKESRPELAIIVEHAFRRDKSGNLSTSAVLSLRRHKIKDERWLRAMDAISDSLQVVLSKSYIRFYEADGNGGWKNISLDFAKI